jgi:hypothetical protein
MVTPVSNEARTATPRMSLSLHVEYVNILYVLVSWDSVLT